MKFLEFGRSWLLASTSSNYYNLTIVGGFLGG